MRNTRYVFFATIFVALATFAAWLAAPGASAQLATAGVDTYAITNARIVTVSGATIERGTVVIRDGLIAAVGTNVQAPPDARTIDGTGLTVYPGLIDASSSLAIPRPTPTPGATPPQGGFPGLFGQSAPAATSPNSSQLPGLQPEIVAADLVHPGGNEVEAARNAGITATQTAPRGNIFLGQSAVINLAGDTPQQMIVRSPVALYVGMTPLGGGRYPGSLMGVFSSLRQLLLDAQRYREAHAVYRRSPKGLRRPELDKSLEALLPVLAREMPVVIQADREREIDRALDLAQEFNLSIVINGGMEAHLVADRLKAMNVPVLLSLNFPKRTTSASPEAEPESLRIMRERAEAPKTAGRLSTVGIRFAFQSGGMTSMSDYLANAARAVEHGLSREEALRAMTLRAAEILGVSQQLGSIEAGKIANLTVTRGDLFDNNRRIAHLFIDGRQIELRPEATATGAPNASGTWTLTVDLGGTTGQKSEFTVTLNLQQENDRLTGSLEGELGSGQIAAGSVTGSEVNFTVPVTMPGPATQTTDAIFKGTLAGNEMTGTVQIVGRGPGTFRGTRPEAPQSPAGPRRSGSPGAAATATDGISGTYSVEFIVGPRSIPATLTFRQQGNALAGTASSEFGTSDISGTANGNDFRFNMTINVGEPADVTVSGTVNGDRISGTATTPGGTGTFSGTRVP